MLILFRTDSRRFFLGAILLVFGGLPAQASTFLLDEFNGTGIDSSKWVVANWAGADFKDVDWQPGHATLSGGKLHITMDKNGGDGPCPANCNAKTYASAQLITKKYFGNNTRMEVRMAAPVGDGLVSSAFRYESGGDEIDFELLGRHPTEVQLNYYVNGSGGHEKIITTSDSSNAGGNVKKILPTDFNTGDYHTYAFETTGETIRWFIDDELVHSADIGTVLDSGQLRLDLWTPVAGNNADIYWAGHFTGERATATYDRVVISAVPLPPALWLFGSVLSLLFGRRLFPRRPAAV